MAYLSHNKILRQGLRIFKVRAISVVRELADLRHLVDMLFATCSHLMIILIASYLHLTRITLILISSSLQSIELDQSLVQLTAVKYTRRPSCHYHPYASPRSPQTFWQTSPRAHFDVP